MQKKKPTTQTERIIKVLSEGKPVTSKALARRARVPYDNISRRIFDLRSKKGMDIVTVTAANAGADKTVYRMG